jgi:hypothetical protein
VTCPMGGPGCSSTAQCILTHLKMGGHESEEVVWRSEVGIVGMSRQSLTITRLERQMSDGDGPVVSCT